MSSAQTAFLRHIDERALAVVVKQAALAHAGYKHVGKSVVVEIRYRHTHSIHLDVQARAPGDIAERSVAIVVVQPERGAPLFVAGPIHPIDQNDVLPAIIIVIEKGAAGAERFRKILAAERAAIVLEINAGWRSNLYQTKRQRRLGIRPSGCSK